MLISVVQQAFEGVLRAVQHQVSRRSTFYAAGEKPVEHALPARGGKYNNSVTFFVFAVVEKKLLKHYSSSGFRAYVNAIAAFFFCLRRPLWGS